MKKLLTSVALVALVAGSGSAFAASGDSLLKYRMPFSCTVNGASNPFEGTFNLSDVNILNPDNSVKAGVDLGSVIPGNVSVGCTGAGAVLSAKTANGGITYNGQATPNIQRISYRASINWDGKHITLEANGNPNTSVASDATDMPKPSLPLTGNAVTMGDSIPLIAGWYADVLTIKVGDSL